ncbi:IclR family transcriptional regulator [Brevibacterium sp. CSND-B09]|uniref:IclR family transcriptional regulator n=1 Tax=Brevibacterium sp. CSND-B09 TaxID=3462571 RepID=UPI00406A49BE
MVEKHRTVSRVIGILEFVVRSPNGATLSEIAEHLDAPKSSVYGFVRGLEAEGYLKENAAGHFVFGLGAHTLLASQATSLVELASPVMNKLGQELGETITLALFLDHELTYVHSVPSNQRIGYNPEMHTRRPLWPTSAGKILLAASETPELKAHVLASEDLDEETLEVEIESVRKRGYGLNIGETVADVSAFALGLKIGSSLAAAITVGGPNVRMRPHIEEMVDTARSAISNSGLDVWNFA